MGTPQIKRVRIAIFASGNGSNAENCILYFQKSAIAEVALVVTNNPQAGVIQRAIKQNVPLRIFSNDAWQNPGHIITQLQSFHIQLIVLAGYLKLIPSEIIQAYPQRIINIHPALLPKYGGKGMYGHKVHASVIANHERETGITIHYANAEYDKGDIIFQKSFPVAADDTAETIEGKVHALEYAFLPKIVEQVAIDILQANNA
ncbi:MAG: phosphoribosylglycinamide formyltransferase [Chitinophagales bacterium]